MAKQYIFDAQEINTMLMTGLYPYIGAAAYVGNYQEIIQLTVESMVSRTTDFPYQDITQLIADYGVPTDIAHDLAIAIRIPLGQHVAQVLRDKIGEHYFQVEVLPSQDVIIRDLGPAKKNHEMAYQEQIYAAIENGDWVSEKYRRMAGGF